QGRGPVHRRAVVAARPALGLLAEPLVRVPDPGPRHHDLHRVHRERLDAAAGRAADRAVHRLGPQPHHPPRAAVGPAPGPVHGLALADARGGPAPGAGGAGARPGLSRVRGTLGAWNECPTTPTSWPS